MSDVEALIEQINKELKELPKENMLEVRNYIKKLKREKSYTQVAHKKKDPILNYIERANKMELPTVTPLDSNKIDNELYGDTR